MLWVRWLRRQTGLWTAQGLDLIYPPRCPICRCDVFAEGGQAVPPGDLACRPSPWAAPVCGRCATELSADMSRCSRCGEVEGAGDGCRRCRRHPPEWRRIVVLSSYGARLREAVLRAKRPAGEDVAASLAWLLVRKHGRELASWDVDRVVPVPMHWLRRSMRGTSFADELSRRIAALLGLRWSRSLVRSRSTRMQNELPITERPRNVEGAFRTRHRLDGERVLILDDVVTTGATLAACSRAVLASGAASVDVAVVAKADRRSGDDS